MPYTIIYKEKENDTHYKLLNASFIITLRTNLLCKFCKAEFANKKIIAIFAAHLE